MAGISIISQRIKENGNFEIFFEANYYKEKPEQSDIGYFYIVYTFNLYNLYWNTVNKDINLPYYFNKIFPKIESYDGKKYKLVQNGVRGFVEFGNEQAVLICSAKVKTVIADPKTRRIIDYHFIENDKKYPKVQKVPFPLEKIKYEKLIYTNGNIRVIIKNNPSHAEFINTINGLMDVVVDKHVNNFINTVNMSVNYQPENNHYLQVKIKSGDGLQDTEDQRLFLLVYHYNRKFSQYLRQYAFGSIKYYVNRRKNGNFLVLYAYKIFNRRYGTKTRTKMNLVINRKLKLEEKGSKLLEIRKMIDVSTNMQPVVLILVLKSLVIDSYIINNDKIKQINLDLPMDALKFYK